MKVSRGISLSLLMVSFWISELTYAQSPAEESFIKGVEYALQGKFPKAKREFEKALKVDPPYRFAGLGLKATKDVIEKKITGETAVHFFTGLSHAKKGQLDQAITQFDLTPKDSDFLINFYKKQK